MHFSFERQWFLARKSGYTSGIHDYIGGRDEAYFRLLPTHLPRFAPDANPFAFTRIHPFMGRPDKSKTRV